MAKAKKTTEKAVKKVTKKTATKKAASKQPKVSNGLTGNQVKVLKALKSGQELNRKQLAQRTGINGGWAKLLGTAYQDEVGAQGPGLSDTGLITVNSYESERILTYTITAKGKKVLQDAS
jgi:hypothetical protein